MCERMPECAVCGKRKCPRGRSAPLETTGGLCQSNCPGYFEAPEVNEHWPEEECEARAGKYRCYICGKDLAPKPVCPKCGEPQNERWGSLNGGVYLVCRKLCAHYGLAPKIWVIEEEEE